jgi:hypothetical protein
MCSSPPMLWPPGDSAASCRKRTPARKGACRRDAIPVRVSAATKFSRSGKKNKRFGSLPSPCAQRDGRIRKRNYDPEIAPRNVTRGITEMTRSTKACPAGAATDSAPDTPPDGQPGSSAAAPPDGPAAAIVAALTAAPGATAAQLARAAGIPAQPPRASWQPWRRLATPPGTGPCPRPPGQPATSSMRRQDRTVRTPSRCRTVPRSPRRAQLPRTRKDQTPRTWVLRRTPGPPPWPTSQA